MNKILSIVIPAYSMEKYLSKCLDSLLIDTALLETIEVLVINDGSKDRTSEIAHSYEEKYPTVFRCIDKENGNYGSCINRGLKEATGTYIKVLDADDTFDTKNFEEYVCYMNAYGGADCIFTDFCMVNEDGTVTKTITYPFLREQDFSITDLPDNINYSMWMHAVTYKTENLRKINYNQTEGISYTDQEWIFLPMSTVKRISYFPRIVYKYLVGRDGQTMNPETFCKNMWMEIKGTKVMVEEFESAKATFSEECMSYLTRQIEKRCSYIYRWFLQFYPKQLNIVDLIEFDAYLKNKSPFLYKEVEKAKIEYRFLRFYFIKDFRKGKSLNFKLFYGLNYIKTIVRNFLKQN